MKFAGFDWDSGNRLKVQKHGVTPAEIEEVFLSGPHIEPDLDHSNMEDRFRAVGQNGTGRYVFLVFTCRRRGDQIFIRPISARYMHTKEIAVYEKAISEIED